MMTPPPLDLDDISRCGLASACDVCGDLDDDLGIATLGCRLGVFCITICNRCTDDGLFPAMSVVEAAGRVAEHCEHLGIDLDQMAIILHPERGQGVA